MWSSAGLFQRSLLGHESSVNAARFSPDGFQIASVSIDDTLRLWNVHDGSENRVVQFGADLYSLDWSPDGSLIACGTSTDVVLFDSASGMVVRQWYVGADRVRSLAFSADGTSVLTVNRLTVARWSVADGHVIWQFAAPGVEVLAIAPDGTSLVTSSDGLTLRRMDDGGEIRTFAAFNDARSIVFGADSRTLAAGLDDGRIRYWDVNTGQMLFEFQAHVETVTALAMSPDFLRLASGDGKGNLKDWSSDDADPGFSTPWVQSYHVDMAPNGLTVAAVSQSAGTNVISFQTFATADGNPLAGAKGTVYGGIRYTPDSGYVVASEILGQAVSVRRVSNGTGVTRMTGHADWVMDVAVSPDGNLIASASRDGVVKLWNTEDWTLRSTLTIPDGCCSEAVAFSPDGNAVAAGFGHSSTFVDYIGVWRVEDLGLISQWPAHQLGATDIEFLPSGDLLVSTSRYTNERTCMWNWKSGALVRELGGPARSVRVSPNGRRLLLGGADGVRILSVPDGTLLVHYKGEARRAHSVAWSHDGAEFMCGRDDSVIFVAENPFSCNTCDANCDGSVNTFDIQGFVNAVNGEEACSNCAGDMNADGSVNIFDLNAFVVCLTG